MYKIFNELNNSIKEIQKISNGLELLNKGINKFKEIIPKFEFKSFEVLQNITKQIIENISSILRENAKKYYEKIGPNGERLVEILINKNWIYLINLVYK